MVDTEAKEYQEKAAMMKNARQQVVNRHRIITELKKAQS
jgi:hypothetical protein